LIRVKTTLTTSTQIITAKHRIQVFKDALVHPWRILGASCNAPMHPAWLCVCISNGCLHERIVFIKGCHVHHTEQQEKGKEEPLVSQAEQQPSSYTGSQETSLEVQPLLGRFPTVPSACVQAVNATVRRARSSEEQQLLTSQLMPSIQLTRCLYALPALLPPTVCYATIAKGGGV